MDTTNLNAINQILDDLNQRKLEAFEIKDLFRDALIAGDSTMLNAIKKYTQSKKSHAAEYKYAMITQLSLEEIKANLDDLSEYLTPQAIFITLLGSYDFFVKTQKEKEHLGEAEKIKLHAEIIAHFLERGIEIQSLSNVSSLSIADLARYKDLLLNHEKYQINLDSLTELALSSNINIYDNIARENRLDKEMVKLKNQFLKELLAKSPEAANTLTIYHDSGHAFVKLKCNECNNGEPAFLSAGLYPGGDDDGDTCPINMETQEDSNNSIDDETFFMVTLSYLAGVNFLGAGSYYYGKGSSAASKFAKGGGASSGLGYLITHNEDDTDKYEMKIEHKSFVSNSLEHIECTDAYENFESLNYKIYNISTEAANKVLERISYLHQHCDKDYQYKVTTSSCLDFAQEIYNLAGLEGDHFNEVQTDGYPLSLLGAYKAIKDFSNFIGQVVDDFYNWEM
jgi:hypothetical protein